MPRRHTYRNRAGCYVLTAIGGEVITYQLTPDGEQKLTAAGITDDQRFDRALLLDLIRSGDAFTLGGRNDGTLPDQMEMDFANDPDTESVFPACDLCRGVSDLHLTLGGDTANLSATLICSDCRGKQSIRPDTSIPLSLVARALLARLLDLKPVTEKSLNVKQFEALLETEFASKWDAVRRHRNVPPQASLFTAGTDGGLVLD